MQIIEPSQQALEITHPISVGIHIGSDGETIEDAVLVPEVIDHADAALMDSASPSPGGRLISGERSSGSRPSYFGSRQRNRIGFDFQVWARNGQSALSDHAAS